MTRDQLIQAAKDIVAHGPATSYPSRASAQRVREVIAGLMLEALRTHPPAKAGGEHSIQEKLSAVGVFKGHNGLEGLADADEFWEQQMYGTRLYYGPGIADYLHRHVLQAAIKLLKQAPLPAAPSEIPGSPQTGDGG